MESAKINPYYTCQLPPQSPYTVVQPDDSSSEETDQAGIVIEADPSDLQALEWKAQFTKEKLVASITNSIGNSILEYIQLAQDNKRLFEENLDLWERSAPTAREQQERHASAAQLLNAYNNQTTEFVLKDLCITSPPPLPRHITKLSIENCPNLVALTCDNLSHLTKLEITNCATFKTLFAKLPKLEHLKITSCPKFEELKSALPLLTYIRISKCATVVIYNAGIFNHLDKLKVSGDFRVDFYHVAALARISLEIQQYLEELQTTDTKQLNRVEQIKKISEYLTENDEGGIWCSQNVQVHPAVFTRQLFDLLQQLKANPRLLAPCLKLIEADKANCHNYAYEAFGKMQALASKKT